MEHTYQATLQGADEDLRRPQRDEQLPIREEALSKPLISAHVSGIYTRGQMRLYIDII